MKRLLCVLLLTACAEQPVLDIYGSTPGNPGWYQGSWETTCSANHEPCGEPRRP